MKRSRSEYVRAVVCVLLAAMCGCEASLEQDRVQAIDLANGPTPSQLEPLARAIGDRRIVLLGENGHGVGEFSMAKAQLIEWLHRELGFDVVVFESGFFECAHAWQRVRELSARDMLYDCLRYPFEQAEVLPVFDLVKSRADSTPSLELAGMDPQDQGYDSSERPVVLHAALARTAPELAARVAAYDTALFLVPDSGGVDDVYAWVLENGEAARAAYDSAAALSSGWQRWAHRLAVGLVERLSARAQAEAAGGGAPASYYELRDEWMARAVAALADSIAGARKLVVWLHNDHARYGDFANGDQSVRPVGSFLREWYGDDVFSIGFFMTRGSIANNSRRERPMSTPADSGIERYLAAGGADAGYLVLTGNTSARVREWAARPRPYLRMGLDSMSLVPAREFDALFFVDSVGPPTYRIR